MRYLVVLSIVIFTPLCWSETDIAAKNCPAEATATLISLQGDAAFDATGNGNWQTVQLQQTLCEGGRIWVKSNSRVSLGLPGNDVLRLNENTVLTLKAINLDKPSLLDVVKGFLHYLSRKPREVKIESGIANAAPLGTEFAFSVDDKKAALWVYEGDVRFFNPQGSIILKPGQAAEAQLGKAPHYQIDIKPQDAVNWALYYPPLLPQIQTSQLAEPAINTAINEFHHGRIDKALARLDAVSPEQQSLNFLKVRGALRLIVGQVEQALHDIRAVQTQNPDDADALALTSVIALTQNRKDEAYALANKAIKANPQSATAYSALSYAQQGRFNLEKALTAAEQAVKNAPNDAMVVARKAELELALGKTSDSEDTAKQALNLDANLERTQTIAGFTHLLRMDTDEAIESFSNAIRLDSTSPLARLGLGLAKIRNGDLAEGRKDIEIAAVLDPNNSLIRSYLGKAYYEEKRSSLADDQFKLAKQRDPKDPTPYFYDALKKQTENRPIEALHDLQKATKLNDNRAVYRSKQLLDSDRAARGATLARIYDNLGFQQRGVVEAISSLQTDPTNYSAHRFLADTYVDQQDRETAQLSELLQAKMLQPININPVQPHLSVSQRGSLNASGIANSSFQDFTRIFERNRPQLLLSGIGGSRNSFGDEAIISGIYNNFSYSLGQYHFESDGINNSNLTQIDKSNSKQKHNIYDVFIQNSLNDILDLQFEYINRDSFLEETNQQNQNPGLLDQEILRGGFHFKPNQRLHLLGLYTNIRNKDKQLFLNEDIDQDDPFSGPFSSTTDTDGHLWQGQLIHSANTYNIVAGFHNYHLGSIHTDTILRNNNSFTNIEPDKDGYNLYAYSIVGFIDKVKLTLGLSYDQHDANSIVKGHIAKWNPKIGLQWDLNNHSKFRVAYFSSYNKPLLIRSSLEQTQIAGFNQYIDDFNNRNFDFYGVALDFSWPGLFSGVEFYRKDSFTFDSNNLETFDNSVDRLRLYCYYKINNNIALSAAYNYEKYNFLINGINNNEPTKYKTHKLPIEIRYFNANGLFLHLTGTWVLQKVINNSSDSKSDFIVFDTSIGYRMPKRRGILSFEIKNLFDNRFNYNDIYRFTNADIYNKNIEFFNDRTILGKITFNF